MSFYNKETLYRIFFYSFFFFKKKKLGFKKIQWKIASFFHANRTKNLYYFINKLNIYKRFFFFYFIQRLSVFLFNMIKTFYLNFNFSKFFSEYTFLDAHLIESSYYEQLDNTLVIGNNQQLKLSFYLLVFYVSFILKFFINMLTYMEMSYIGLPITRNTYTILRSPHIDKKSREQFEMKHFSVVMNELSILSIYNNLFLFNSFKFFIANFKLEERLNNLNIYF